MNDYTRLVFERLHRAGTPDADARARLYAQLREEVAGGHADEAERARILDALEKAIRRQEMQALYEEGLIGNR